jgi:hypothetical protein
MNQTILYFECNSGISGDMAVGALLDLGASREVLTSHLASLPLTGYSIRISDVYKSGLRACDFNVILDPEHENHDHDMEYLHGHTEDHVHSYGDTCATAHVHNHEDTYAEAHVHNHGDTCTKAHEHSHEEHHEPSHTAAHAHHHHTARNLHDIIDILNQGCMTDSARSLAIRIFTILAEAEASVHGKSVEEVHFHEVGAVDSIVDIAAAAICIDNLHPDQIIVSALTDGTGTIRCQHGIIPVPVPAVSAIAAAHHLPLKLRPIEGELVTPTGAAIAAAVQTGEQLPEEFQIIRTGLGAGKRNYPTTGVLRAMLLQPLTQPEDEKLLMLQTNIDDCTGEALSFTLGLLMESGARDAYYTPVYMKKNRPAYLLTVLCEAKDRPRMEQIIFRHTTTIGIRAIAIDRTRLDRENLHLETPWGPADVKVCTCGSETYYYPENDSVSRLALREDLAFPEMYHKIKEWAQNQTK